MIRGSRPGREHQFSQGSDKLLTGSRPAMTDIIAVPSRSKHRPPEARRTVVATHEPLFHPGPDVVAPFVPKRSEALRRWSGDQARLKPPPLFSVAPRAEDGGGKLQRTVHGGFTVEAAPLQSSPNQG